MQRQRFSKVCESCVMDCKEIVMYSKNDCQYYEEGFTVEEYKKMIREENLNIKKFCNKNGLSRNCLLNMLANKQPLKFKYRVLLNERLAERDEYLPYVMEGN